METLDDLITQHNTTYRTVSVRVSDEVFEWLKDTAAKMKVSRAKLTELMFNHGYEHFINETNGSNGGLTVDDSTVDAVDGDGPKFDEGLEVTVAGREETTETTAPPTPGAAA